jgi:acyl-coenzyme A thioesterase PaaI-like protein
METDAPEAELTAAAEAAERFNARLESGPRGRPLWGFAERSTSAEPGSFYDNSPISGPANPLAPPVTITVDGPEVRATAEFGIAYEGPPGHVHGGYVAAAFDEVLGAVQSASGSPGMTGRLTVHYRRPTPLLKPLVFRGRVDRIEGRKIFTVAELWDGATLVAEAEGLFISVGEGRFRELAEGAGREMPPPR